MENSGKWGHGTNLDTIKIEDPKQYENIKEKQESWKGISAEEYYDQLYKEMEEKNKD